MEHLDIQKEMSKMAKELGMSNEDFDSLMCRALATLSVDNMQKKHEEVSSGIKSIQQSIEEKFKKGARRTNGSLKFPI